MIQHVLMWSYREETSDYERAAIEAALDQLPEQVPSLLRLEWGPVVGGRNMSFTHCFVMHFYDMSGLQEYAVHPDHARFAAVFREACAEQVVVDFEVANG